MAQRLEQGTHNPLVAGSNPARPTRSNMRSIRYRSHFFMNEMCRFREYSNRYGFSRRLQLHVPEKVAILLHVSRCAVSGYFILVTMHHPMRLFSAGVSIDGTFAGALGTVTSNLFMKLTFDTVPVFFSTRRRYRCPLDGEPPLDGHFLCIFRAAMPYIWIYRQIGSDIGYHR